MSIKDLRCDENDMKIPSDDHSLRISMEYLKLKDSEQGEKHIRANKPSLLSEQNNQLIGIRPKIGNREKH